jgi:hypothetical protein
MSETHQCIGFANKAFTTPCPEPVTSLIRVCHNGQWASWKEACDFHAAAAVDVLSQTEGYEIKRQPLCKDCPDLLRSSMGELGTDITVSLAHLVVADLPSRRITRLVCGPCGERDRTDAALIAKATSAVWLFALIPAGKADR